MDENSGKGIIGTSNENAEGMEEMSSSSMNNKNASGEIENKEQKSNKKRIKFVNWFLDSLDWFKRPELAQSSLSTSSYAFKQYCWPKLHGAKVKPRIVRELRFTRKLYDEGNCQAILKKGVSIEIPIADINPPDYIIGFEEIIFWFIDDQILTFVEKILPLLNEVKMDFGRALENNPQDTTKRLMEMLAPKTNKLEILDNDCLSKFNQQFPNFIPCLRSILMQSVCKQIDMDLVVQWLTTPREDGKPRMLEIEDDNCSYANALTNRVKTEFIHSTEPANFIICMFRREGFEDFKIENEATKEMLELKCEPNKFFLVRHKNDTETMTKVDWEEQMKLKSNTTIWFL